MNKAELIEALAQRSGLQKQKAKKLLEAYVDIVTEAMSHNEEIVLIGFGTLIPRPQTERLARNPQDRNTGLLCVEPSCRQRILSGQFEK